MGKKNFYDIIDSLSIELKAEFDRAKEQLVIRALKKRGLKIHDALFLNAEWLTVDDGFQLNIDGMAVSLAWIEKTEKGFKVMSKYYE